MYVTAQRVRRRTASGINAFLHDAPNLNQVDWEEFDRGEVEIGELLRQHAAVPPGGNSVLSFLDVIGPGELTVQQLAGLPETQTTQPTEHGCAWHLAELTARYSWCGGDRQRPALDEELRELVEAVTALIRATDRQPLEIVRTLSSDGLVFELAPGSVERLRARHGDDWRAPRVRLPTLQLDQWRSQGAARLDDQVIKVLTGLTDEELVAEGGVKTTTRSD